MANVFYALFWFVGVWNLCHGKQDSNQLNIGNEKISKDGNRKLTQNTEKSASTNNNNEQVTISSSCGNLENGLRYIKPMADNEIIPVICSDGFAMIDPSLNFDLITESYFTSIKAYGDSTRLDVLLYGPDCGESKSWKHWFLPANDKTKFLVSFGCTGECSQSSKDVVSDKLANNVAYYATTGYLCPTNNVANKCDNSVSGFGGYNEIYCGYCDDSDGMCGSSDMWCDCWSLQLRGDIDVSNEHDNSCVGGSESIVVKPVISNDRSLCTCFENEEAVETYQVSKDDLPAVSSKYKGDIIESGISIDALIKWDEDVEVEENSMNVISKSNSNSNNDKRKLSFGGATENTVKSLPNSCVGLDDGLHWLQLLEPSYTDETTKDEYDYPPVLANCYNGYMIINTNVDDNFEKYFYSFQLWHKSVAGPDNDNRLNWEEWFIPDGSSDEDEFNYIISPDCSTCEEDNDRQIYETKTTYWMTGRFYGCFWHVTGSHNCDMDWDTSECYACLDWHTPTLENRIVITDDTSDGSLFDYTGLCSHNVRKSTHYIPHTHDECATWESFYDDTKFHLKPAIGTKGKWCQCVKPSSQSVSKTYDISSEMFDKYESEWQAKQTAALEIDTSSSDEDDNVDNSGNSGAYDDNRDVYYLYQKDFEGGTYRIQKAGKYIIMEDIVFDFAAMPDSPNAPGAYWPTEERDLAKYPGSGSTRDAYNLGWFAGITVESHNVEIDLNYHTLSMSEYFYYQQRWFTVIELGSQYFLPGQGITNFGANPFTAENVIIKNGVLGLSAHHGIHGNYNKNVRISNVDVMNFESHGLQFNGFDGITLENVNIGPTSNKAFFQGTYAHARGLIHRYRAMIEDELTDEEAMAEIKFHSRQDKPTNFKKIVARLESAMDYAFDYVTKGLRVEDIEGDEEKELFEQAVTLFVNKAGIPDGGAQYGIFLNTFGASVMTYNLYSDFYSTTVTLKNINIHGMQHKYTEYVRLRKYSNGDESFSPFNGPLNFKYLIGIENYETLVAQMQDQKNGVSDEAIDSSLIEYKGNPLYDAIVVTNYLSDNWSFLQIQNILNSYIVKWALQGISSQCEIDQESTASVLSDVISLGCNSDVMFHTGKGTQGLRLDGIENVHMENIQVYDNMDMTPEGHSECGDYANEETSYYQFKFENQAFDETKDNPDDAYVVKTLGIKYVGHDRMTPPMQVGFSGNMNQGININAAKNVYIKDVSVNNLVSKTGPVFGVSIWPATEITFDGNIDVNNLFAGYDIADGEYTYEDRPNKASEVCAVRIYEEYNNYYASISVNDDVSFSSQCISGHIGCLGDDDTLHYYLSTDEIDNDVTTCTNNYNELNSNDGMNYVKVANIMKNANIADDLKIHVNSEEVSTNSMFNIDWSSNLHDGIFLAEFIMVICGSLGIIVLFLARNYSNKLKRKQSEYRLL